MAKRFVHLVVPAGAPPPLYAFAPSDAAYTTARAILGVDVITVEVLDALPEHIRDDFETDFDDDDDTPVEKRARTKTVRNVDKVVINVDDID